MPEKVSPCSACGMGIQITELIASIARLEQKVDDLVDRVNHINGSTAAHAVWIAGRSPLCDAHVEAIRAMLARLEQHQSYIDQARGERRASVLIASLISGIVSLALATAAHFSITRK